MTLGSNLDQHSPIKIATVERMQKDIFPDPNMGLGQDLVENAIISAGGTGSKKNTLGQTQPVKIITERSSIDTIQALPSSKMGATLDQSVLVVGGTDGSGTRRVVELLTLLGVTMVSEDPETFDIHADIVLGWPNVVAPVLKHTHTVAYNPLDLPESLQRDTNNRIGKILQLAKQNSMKPQSRQLAVGGKLTTPPGVAPASGVSFGIKAPVAMTLVPSWKNQIPNFKFLHVVRDGRDIAFSANQV